MAKNTSQISIRDKILDYLDRHQTDISRDELEQTVFRSSTNIRLTYQGNKLMARYFDSYPHHHDVTVLSKHLIGLSRDMRYPYYFSDKMLVLYSELDALMINLHGSVTDYLEYLSVGV